MTGTHRRSLRSYHLPQWGRILSCLLAALLTCGGTVFAQEVADPGFERGSVFRPRWSFSAEPAQTKRLSSAVTERVPLARLWPTVSVSLTTAALKSSSRNIQQEIIPVNTLMVVLEGPVFAACELERPRRNPNLTCMIDPERDGKFDYYFRIWEPHGYLLGDVKPNPKSLKPLSVAVPYLANDNWAEEDKLLIGASAWLDDSVIYGKSAHLSFCISQSDINDKSDKKKHIIINCLTDGVRVNLNYLPIQRYVIGTLVKMRGDWGSGVYLETTSVVSSGTTVFGSGECDPDILFDPIKNCG